MTMRRRSTFGLLAGFATALLALGAVVPVAQGADGAGDGSVPVRVNANGGEVTDSAGVVWSADRSYSQGEWGYDMVFGSGSTSESVAGTGDDELYQGYNLFTGGAGYSFDLPDGDYEVTVKMVEDWANAPGQRVFDVAANGDTVLSGFDIFAECGALTACDRSFPVSVSGGRLSVGFTMNGGSNFATVSAISVVAANGDDDPGPPDDPDPEPPEEPPAAPSGLAVTGTTTTTVSLAWQAGGEGDEVTGYRVIQDGEVVAETEATSHTVTGLAADTSYEFAVVAVNEAGESGPSNTVTATTQPRGEAPD
ncbi:chitinase, partial [Haloechinothrix sp. LS1_15]|nr:chitinase [Haloechinothrix sp. LS1_15]